MPTREIKTTLALDGEKKFKQEMQAAARELRVLGSEMKANTSAFGDNANSMEALSSRGAILEKQVAQQKEIIEALAKAVEDSTAKYGEADKRTDGYRIQLNNAAAALGKMEKELQQNNEAIDNYGENVAEAAKNSEEMREAQEKLSKTLDIVKGAVMAVGAAISATFVGAVSFSKDSQQAFNDMQAQIGATDEEMEKLKKTALDVFSDNFGDDIKDVTDSMSTIQQVMGMAAVDDNLKEITEQALLMKDTFGFEVTESIDTVNSLMANFKISAKEAYNLIAQGAQHGANKNGDLLDVMKEYSPNFKALGIDAEEFTDTLIQGAISGAFQIDKVGDAVKEFGIRAKDGSKTSAEGFKALGLDADKMFNTFSQGGPEAEEAFQDVIQKLYDMKDPLAQNQAGVALFGTMFEDLGMEAIYALGDIEDYAKNSIDALGEINRVKYDDIGSALQGLGRQLVVNIAGPIGEELTPRIGEIIQKVKEFDMAPIINALKWILDNAGTIAALAAGIGAGMATWNVVSTIRSVVAAVKAWTIATEGATLAQKLLNGALKANPIGIIITIITTLVTAIIVLWKTNEDFRNKVIEIWTSVKDTIKGVVEVVKNFFTKTIPDALTSALNAMKTWIKNMIETARVEIPNVINTILSFFGGLPEKMLEIGGNIVQGLWDGIQNMAGWLKDKISGFVDGIVDNVKGVLGISSPSTVMRDEIGTMIGAGIAEGITRSARSVNLAIDNLNRDLLKRAVKNISSNMDVTVNGRTTGGIAGVSGSARGSLVIINRGTIVGSNGMEEFASIISKKVAVQFGLSGGGGW